MDNLLEEYELVKKTNNKKFKELFLSVGLGLAIASFFYFIPSIAAERISNKKIKKDEIRQDLSEDEQE